MSMGRKNVTNAMKLFMLAFCFCHREKPAMSYDAAVCAITHNFHWNRLPVLFIHSISHTPVASILELLKNAFSVSYGV